MGIADTVVSVDGTWQQRGYTSLNGAVAAISVDTSQILNAHIMRRFYQICNTSAKFRECDPEKLTVIHNCTKNHEGTAPAMEVAGIQTIFKRYIVKHNLRYRVLR